MSNITKPKIVFELSHHAVERQQQRGISCRDIELVLHYGEAVDDGFVLSDRALARARREIKRVLQRLDHLAGVAVIEEGGTLVTTYRADARRLRRLRAGESLREPRQLH